jgi:hypothetical protein
MSVGVSDLQTAFSGLSAVIQGIERIVAWRAEKRRQKQLRLQGQQYFLHQFSFAGAPDDEAIEEETIRSYCRKLQNIIRTHWGFIFGKGHYNAEAAHAFMASTLFHVAAMPGLPPQASQVQTSKSIVKGYLKVKAVYLSLENLAQTYQNAKTKLSDVIKLLEETPDFQINGLSITIGNVNQDIAAGFAIGANLQATMVSMFSLVTNRQDTAQAIASSSYGYPLAIVQSVDEQTSQINVADLMASQSSPEELDAAYTRVESRCAESISRSASPCNSQYSYSNYSSECPTPVSPTFSQPAIPSIVIPNQGYSTGIGFGPYGNGSTSAIECECVGTGTSDGWGWGNQVEPQVSDPYNPNLGRSASCRW